MSWRNVDTSLCWCLTHLFCLNSSIADVRKGTHVFHPVLCQWSAVRLKGSHLCRWTEHLRKLHDEKKENEEEGLRIKDITIFLRHFQSSTRAWPAGRTVFKTSGPLSTPNNSFPMSCILLSTCILWDMASINCFWASTFLTEPSGALRYCTIGSKITWVGWALN